MLSSNSDDVIFYNNNVLVKYEAHLKMVIVDVDALVAENWKRPEPFFSVTRFVRVHGLDQRCRDQRRFRCSFLYRFHPIGFDFLLFACLHFL